MKPRTRTEKEVVRLSGQLSNEPTEYQKRWMLSHSNADDCWWFHRRRADVMHFIVVTTCHGWQVLRHFYCYAYYRHKKLVEANFHIVMEEWLKDGQYVFLSRDRLCIGCVNDAWELGHPMEVRHGRLGGYAVKDPREIGYCDVLFVRVQKKYRYLPADEEVREYVNTMYRAVNANPYNETLLKQNKKLFNWSRDNGFLYDKEKTAAIKIAQRYHFEIDYLWRDMIDALAYLGKDLHNPTLVCGGLDEHDRWCAAAARKREKMREKMERVRQIGHERTQLRQMEEQKKNAQAAIPYYKKARGRFFGLVIAENDLEIKVLQSVQEFMEEGKEMGHCVFANGYYDVKRKPNSLILSAKVGGKRTETIEVDLSKYEVVQSRGKHNSSTPYHNTILNLVNANMNQIKQLNTARL